jgi:hypothetical protein
MLWLEPISYQQMLEMMEKAKAMAAKAREGKGAPESAKKWGKPEGKPSGRPEGKPTAKKEGEKKKSWSRGGNRMRSINLRSGAFPAKKPAQMKASWGGGKAWGKPKMGGNSSSSVVWLERSDNTIQPLKVSQRRGSTAAEYKSDDGGWYRLYAYNDLGVKDKVWVNLFSYYSFMSHGDKPEKQSPPPMVGAGYFDGHPELELKRVYADGKPAYRSYVGEDVRVRAIFRGMPVEGARMVMTTEQGWRQSKTTDANGEAKFTLIKEDFPEEVDSRKSELYMISLKHEVPNSGKYRGVVYEKERYVATMPFRVSPDKNEWQIQYLAYLAAIITIVGSGIAIAIRRKRRVQK